MRTLLAAVGVASVIGSANAGPQLQTLYRSGSGPIAAFAQDGPLLAWFAPSTRRCNAVHILSLANGTTVTLPRQGRNARNVTCRWEMHTPAAVRLALAGSDALWTLREQSPVPYDYAVSAGVGDRNERRFRELAHTNSGAGLWLGGIAGDEGTLVYSVTAVSYVDQVACLAHLSKRACRLRIAGRAGGIHRLTGRKDVLIHGTGPALAVAAAGRRVAYIPAARVDGRGQPVAGAGRPIPVRDTRTGRLVSRAAPRGTAQALALSRSVLAVLVRRGRSDRIAWYDPADGRLQGSVAVPRAASPELSASDRFVVFRVGRSIRVVDTVRRRVRTVAKAAAKPIGLSLEGTRIAWAENVHDRGRIQALHLG